MQGFNWYRLFNLDQFLALDLVSTEVVVSFEALGDKSIMVYQGNRTSIVYEGDMLSIGLNDRNPFRIGARAVFLDPNRDVWLGLYHAN